MSSELGAWLREQREIRGWARPEMARRLIEAGKAAGDRSLPGLDSMCHNLYRWERGSDNPSERYKLYYSRALSIPLSQLGADQGNELTEMASAPGITMAPPASGLPGVPERARSWPGAPGAARPALRISAAIAYGGMDETGLGRFAVEHEVLMAAHEGSNHAEEYEQHGIGEATFEQLRSDVKRLSRLSDEGEPFATFLDMRRIRDRVYRLLERRQWPREQTDLFFLLGCLNGLMGVTANRLGYPDAAEELIRAGWAHANAIDHRPLLAQLRYEHSYVEHWRGRMHESRDLAASGLDYLSDGPGGGELHLQIARAAARLGDADTVRRAVADANDAREREHSDDLLEIGGEFVMSLATHHGMAGSALAEIAGAEHDAAEELERAVSLYDAGPEPGEEHWFGGRALVGIDLAVVRIRTGALDAAVAALEPAFSLPPALRVGPLTARLGLVRTELTAPIFRNAVPARELDEQIEEFGRETVTAGLHGLSSGPG